MAKNTKSRGVRGFADVVLDGTHLGASESKNEKGEEKERTATTHFVGQLNMLGDIQDPNREEINFFWIEPEKCRIWEHHNRRYDLLNEVRCQDLIEGIKVQGRQEFPAIVRPVKDDPNHKYEVICGARRHWTISWLRMNNYTEFKFLVQVKELTDEQAFRLSDVENRDRQDISDYERALDYKNALGLWYGGKQKAMAERLEVSESWLSRFLDLAELPKEIVKAYRDVTDIKLRHAMELKPLIESRKEKILKAAVQIKDEQDALRRNNEPLLDGAEVIRRLKNAIKAGKKTSAVLHEYFSSTGKRMMTVTRNSRSALMFKVELNCGASHDEILEMCRDALEEHMKTTART